LVSTRHVKLDALDLCCFAAELYLVYNARTVQVSFETEFRGARPVVTGAGLDWSSGSGELGHGPVLRVL
jgi:hypothetical protein